MNKILMKIPMVMLLILCAGLIVWGIATWFMPFMLIFKIACSVICMCAGFGFGAIAIMELLDEKEE